MTKKTVRSVPVEGTHSSESASAREMRMIRGPFTQEEFAEQSGIPLETIKAWEEGRERPDTSDFKRGECIWTLNRRDSLQ